MDSKKFIENFRPLDVIKKTDRLKRERSIYHLHKDMHLSHLNIQYKDHTTLLKGGTGIGKTEEALAYKSRRHIALSLPLISILMNKEREGVVSVYGEGAVHGGFNFSAPRDEVADGALFGKHSMGTYDSMLKMTSELLSNTVVFYDEIQYAIDAQGYRDRLAPSFNHIMKNSPAQVLMSGTMYEEAILPFVDEFIEVTKDGEQTRAVTLIVEEKRETTSLDFAYKALIDMPDENYAAVLVQNKDNITQLKKKLIDAGWNESEIITYVAPESDLTAINTPQAEEMIRTGVIPKGVRVILWTSAALVGADLRHAGNRNGDLHPVAIFHSTWIMSPEAIAQMCGRFRDANAVEAIVGMPKSYYDEHFIKPSRLDMLKTLKNLRFVLGEADNYHGVHSTLKGAGGKMPLVMFDNGEINLIGCMKFIQDDVIKYVNHEELYERFNMEIVETITLARPLTKNEHILRGELEQEILAMPRGSIDMEHIESLLDTNDEEGLNELPKPIREFILFQGEMNANAKKYLWEMVALKNSYQHPYTLRHKKRKVDKEGVVDYPSISGMLNVANSKSGKWLSNAGMREALVKKFDGQAVTKKQVIAALGRFRAGGKVFYSEAYKRQFMGKLKKKGAKFSQILGDIVNIEEVGHLRVKDNRKYLIKDGAPLAMVHTLREEWVAKQKRKRALDNLKETDSRKMDIEKLTAQMEEQYSLGMFINFEIMYPLECVS